mgnify:FL=1
MVLSSAHSGHRVAAGRCALLTGELDEGLVHVFEALRRADPLPRERQRRAIPL